MIDSISPQYKMIVSLVSRCALMSFAYIMTIIALEGLLPSAIEGLYSAPALDTVIMHGGLGNYHYHHMQC